MTRITAAQHRVQQASDLAAVLDAAYHGYADVGITMIKPTFALCRLPGEGPVQWG